jgi:hypothetical protein
LWNSAPRDTLEPVLNLKTRISVISKYMIRCYETKMGQSD